MAEPAAKIGVVTVTYNSGKVIEAFMASTLAQTHHDFVLFVIDNASKDNTLARLEPVRDPRLVLIKNADNVGVAAANNQGIRAALLAGCSHVLLINNDVEYGPALFSELLAGLSRHRCQITVPKMMYFDQQQKIWFAGGHFVRWKLFANVHDGENELDRGQYDQARRIEYAPTCCMLVEAAVFQQIGLMDEKYFVYYDDTDFCLRALRAGVSMFLLPDQVLFHKVSSLTGGVESDFAIKYGVRNRVYYVRKHVPLLTLPALAYIVGRTAARVASGRYKAKQVRIVLNSLRDGLKLSLAGSPR
jgi:GT2 family glycosyltransferase